MALRGATARVHAGVKEGRRRGLDEVQIRKTVDLCGQQELERPNVIGRTINRVYREVEKDRFDA